MHKITATLLCCILAAGCSGVDEIFLSPQEADDLVTNFEVTVEAQQLMSEFSFEAARGDIDLNDFPGYTYDPPTALNNWVGSLTIPNGDFPFGTGDLTIDFTTLGDGIEVDPFAVDLTTAGEVSVDAVIDFAGTSNVGEALTMAADFTMVTTQNAADSVASVVNGTFDIVHAGYDAALNAVDLALDLDLLLNEVTSITGSIDGTVDIPNFAFDANFDLEGLGDAVTIGLDVAATTIDYTLDLVDLF